MKNILHLSDLHFSTSDKFGFNITNASILIDTLIYDINEQNTKIDTVFITGDISFSGQESEYKLIKENFITPLLSRLELTENNLYLVPGNHDMDRSKVSTVEVITRKHSGEDDVKDVFYGVNNKGESWERLENFNQFYNDLKKQQSKIVYDSPLITVRDSGKNLRIHCINSAWFACDDEDQGLLRVLPLLSDTLTKYGKNKRNILLMHHPLNWMHKNEINTISRLIEKQVDAVFYGHMHEFEQSVTINFSNDITLKLQAGTIDLRNDNAGYSLISLDSNDSFEYGKIYYRKYDNENKKYKPWVERIENGHSDFSIDKRAIFDSSKFCDKSSELIEDIEYSHLINIGKSKSDKFRLSDIFIEPKFNTDHALTESLPNIGRIESFLTFESVDGCTLVSATEQQGRTTLLKKLQLTYLEKQSKYNFQNIIFYIDLNIEYSTPHKILNQFIANYEDSDLQTSFSSKIKACINDGNAIFLVDNYDRCTDVCQSSIDKFIKKHTNNRFVITGEAENNFENLTKLVNIYSGEVYNATLSNIARCDIRQIISRRPINSPLHSDDELFHNLIKIVDNSQLPHNHFVYSILLIIYEEKHKLVGILNEADIIENYIEILLQKHCMTTSKNTPEYKVLLHFLGFLCSKLILQRKTFITEKKFHTYIMEFEALTFNEYPFNSYIKPVLESGILISNGNSIFEFSNSCFLYFFSAYYMNTNENLKSFIFDSDNYKYLDKIVEYYASINSTNFDVLNFFEEKVISARELISSEILKSHNIDIELLNIDEIPAVSLLDLASTSDEFENSINELNISQQKYDEVLDEKVPLRGKKESNSNVDHNVEVNDDSLLSLIANYRKELSIFSKVFRNTELVMDPEEVMRMFDFILDSYVFLIKADIASLNDSTVLPLLLPKFEEQVSNGVINKEDKDELLKNFKLILSIIRAFVPNTVEHMLSNNLSTKKPRFTKILNNKLEVINSNDMEELLIRFLLLDIERGNFKHHIEELYKIQGKITSSALFLKLLQLTYTRHDFKDAEQTFLQNKLLDLIKDNRTLNGDALKKISSLYNN